MRNKLTLPAIFFLCLVIPPCVNGQKMKAEEVISRHLTSIGPADKRALIKSLVAVGDVRVDYITQKNQSATGRIVIASEGNKMFFGMKLNALDYPQEKILFDVKKADVAIVRGGARSVL